MRKEFSYGEIEALSEILYGGEPNEQFTDMSRFEWFRPYPEGCSVYMYRGKTAKEAKFDFLFSKDRQVAFEHDSMSAIKARLSLFANDFDEGCVLVWVHSSAYNEVLKHRRRFGYERYKQVRGQL